MRARGWFQELHPGRPRQGRLENSVTCPSCLRFAFCYGYLSTYCPTEGLHPGPVDQVWHPLSAGLQMQLDLGTLG
jgi:hypothetical protein